MEIYVIRHTRVATEKGICYGQTDVPVGDTFEEELKLYQERLPAQFDCIYSSDLKRCRQLAEHFGDDVVVDTRLRELNFGDWEMKKWVEIDRESLDEWSVAFDLLAPPKGEKFAELVHRVNEMYQEWKRMDYDRILLVTHAGVIRALWAILLEIPLKNSFKIPVDFGEVLVIDSTFDQILSKK